MADVLDIFGLDENDLIENNKSHTVNKLDVPPSFIDYKNIMKSYLSCHHPLSNKGGM